MGSATGTTSGIESGMTDSKPPGTARLHARGTGSLDPARLLEGLTALPEPKPLVFPDPQGTDRLLETPRPSPVGLLNTALRQEAGRLFANWVVRAMNLPQFRARPDLPLAAVKTGMPELVVATLEAVSTADPALNPEVQMAVAQAAVALARRRAVQGFSLREVLTELQEWSLELLTAVWRAVDDQPTLAGAPRVVIERLAQLTFEAATAVAEDWIVGPAEAPS